MTSSTSSSAERRVFVVGAYIPNGGTYMAYHLGRMLHRDFGLSCFAVGEPMGDNPVQYYDTEFPVVSMAEMESEISDRDILIANPSFSSRMFGLRLPGRKLMYIQGFTTYSLLDCFFHHYVCVSQFVAGFVKNTYGLDAAVIPAFIQIERSPVAPPWQQRPPGSVLVNSKGNDLILDRVRRMVADKAPEIDLSNEPGPAPHPEFMANLGAYRHLLSLSPAEGFGLVPLEAMAMGTTVIGFDGFGGREYMKSGHNSLVTSYPDIDGVVDHLIHAVRNPGAAEQLAAAGRYTAECFSYARFRTAWLSELSNFLSK